MAAPFDVDAFTRVITPLSVGTGLQAGDTLLAIDSKPFEGLADYQGALREHRRGELLQVRIRSAGSGEKDVLVPPRPFTYLGFAAGHPAYPWIILVRIAMPLLCLALGFWVAAVRVGDSAAWLLLLLMLSIANQIGDSRTLEGNQDPLQPLLTGFGQGLANLAPTTLALFGIVFVYFAATVNTAAVAKHHGVSAFVNMSQMTLTQMSITETTPSPQHKPHWLAEQALNWSGLPVGMRGRRCFSKASSSSSRPSRSATQIRSDFLSAIAEPRLWQSRTSRV